MSNLQSSIQSKQKPQLNWSMVLFFTLTPLISLIGTGFLAYFHMIKWQTVLLAVLYIPATAMTITGGYHRLFSHSSYRAKWPVKLMYMLFGAAAVQGSALEWASDHRNHHRYTDTNKDPYNIKQGFWYAHIGWIFYINPEKRSFDNVTDLTADPLLTWQHRHFKSLLILFGFISPALIACLWGDPLGGLIIAGGLRMSVQHHLTWCINSVCHYFGNQTYDDSTARDNWFTALFTFGEGYHNFHHKFPIDYRNGVRFYHFDPTKWLIKLLSMVGQASHLKRVPQQKIIEYRMRMERQRIEAKALRSNSKGVLDQLSKLVEPAYKSVVEVLHKIEAIEKKYASHKLNKKDGNHSIIESTSTIKKSRKMARKELRQALTIWTEMLRQSNHMIASA